MTRGVKTFIYSVRELAKVKSLYGELAGVEPYTDEAYYVGFDVGGKDVGLDPNGHSNGMTGPLAYWHVDDIENSLNALLDAGAEVQQDIRDVGEGRLIASVRTQTATSSGFFSHHSCARDESTLRPEEIDG